MILKFQLISNKIAGSGFRYYLTAELLNVELLNVKKQHSL